MNLLEGSIAFALALAGFATLCTVLIEVYHRAVGQRAQDLRDMLRAYYVDVVKPRLKAAGVSNGAGLEGEFLQTLTTNVLAKRLVIDGKELSRWQKRRLALDVLDTKDFLDRVQKTQVFAKLTAKRVPAGAPAAAATAAAAPADPAATAATAPPAPAAARPPVDPARAALLDELGAEYAAFGKSATFYFRDRARILSLVAGIFLALLGNIHSGRIFDAFIKNPDLAVRMEAQAGAIRTALAAASPQVGQAIGDDLAQVQNALKDYQAMGLPIGWNYYPNCFGGAEADPRCARARPQGAATDDYLPVSVYKTATAGLLAFTQWLFVVLVTGLLIGLGGPFWYDLAVKLSTLRALFNGKAPLEAQNTPAAQGGDQAGK